ncbi:MAG: hypothetical protein WC180_02805 [Candidatus Paceibacterota bacterium]
MKNSWQTIKKAIFNKKNFYVVLILALMIIHGLYDSSFKVDNFTIMLVIILILLPYASLIKKIKFGDFEAEITQEEINSIKKKVDEIPKNEKEKTVPEIVDQLNELVEYDPGLALAKARIEIERKIIMLADIYLDGRKKTYNLRGMVRSLKEKNIIDHNLGAALEDVIVVANRTIHGEDISKQNAVKLVNIAGKIIQALDNTILEKVLDNATTKNVGKDVVEEYENAHYLLETIIPYVEKPEIKTYKVNQQELDAFLEGYNEYAETIIKLEKIDDAKEHK